MTVEMASQTRTAATIPGELEEDKALHPYEDVPSQFQYGSRLRLVELRLGQSNNELLLRTTKVVSQRYGMEFARLSPIQRKFLTHYRCSQCGLLPLYHVILTSPKRVRCGKCHQMMPFRRRGKYGKMRKDIAIEFMKICKGDAKS
jgi:hypothetical protein